MMNFLRVSGKIKSVSLVWFLLDAYSVQEAKGKSLSFANEVPPELNASIELASLELFVDVIVFPNLEDGKLVPHEE